MKPDRWDAALPGCCCFLSLVSPNETGKDSLISPPPPPPFLFWVLWVRTRRGDPVFVGLSLVAGTNSQILSPKEWAALWS